jgi:flagellar hook-basal body complex protein FliE
MSDQVSPTSPNSAYKQNNFEDQSPEKLHDVTLALDK